MKQATLLTVCITVVHLSFASPKIDCAIENPRDSSSSMKITSNIHEILLEIMNVTGLQANFELKQADVLNIEASISHRKRYILYNPAFINRITNLTKDKWAAMALLAHEVGHHLNGHTIGKTGSTPALELQADEFAGFILYKLGATLQQSQSVMNYIARKEDSRTHPSRNSRMQAIEKGWTKASGLEEIVAVISH